MLNASVNSTAITENQAYEVVSYVAGEYDNLPEILKYYLNGYISQKAITSGVELTKALVPYIKDAMVANPDLAGAAGGLLGTLLLTADGTKNLMAGLNRIQGLFNDIQANPFKYIGGLTENQISGLPQIAA